ncbi:MAG TPA: gamma-glutamyl-gamma-aminobutyrate hydrolase family protein [Chloroflexota bacterium]|nr:gamma-glutamyl-gamma-aminobutyrate hydrolase family protein [Chloroflexota bacterium]
MTVRIGVSYVSPDASGTNYLEALRRAGAEPVVLATPENCPRWLTAETSKAFFAPDNPAIAELDHLDGLLLTGGGDADPMLYRELTRGSDPPNWPRDHVETAQFHRARQRGLPILGICRGFQFLNVAMGGSLIQHLPNWETHWAEPPRRLSKEHRVRLAPESRLNRILGDEKGTGLTIAVNSRHHQAVSPERLAPGLLNAGESVAGEASPDSPIIVEGSESPATREGKEFILGVQWHPERVSDAIAAAPGQPLSWQQMSERLFKAFVAAALTS